MYSLFWSVTIAVLFGQVSILFGEQLSSLFIGADQVNPGPREIIDAALPMLKVALSTMFLCAIMNVAGGSLRSMGYSIASMIGCIVCVVGGRLMWIYFVFPMERFHSGAGLIASFPAAWALASVSLTVILVVAMFKTKKKFAMEAMPKAGDK